LGEAAGEGGGERVAKLLARAGVGSRRDVERLIGEGRVAINGRTLETPAVKVESGDIVTVDGEVVGEPEPARLFRYHKPVGLVTTHKDPNGRPTVFDALPEGLPRLISVGRLDINSEGLLLLTNDGQLARALEMPSTQIVRRYRARAHGRTTQEKLDTLQAGVTVEGVRYGPIEAKLDKAKEGPQGANLWLTVTLHEGKNREVRRVLESIGLKVNRLIRLAYGPLALGTLGVGEIEEVGPRVVREQFAPHIDPDNLPTGERPQYRVKPKTSRREPTPGGAEALARPTEPKVKPAYKAGWAKPKIKVRAHPPPKKKAGAKSEGPTAFGPRPTGPKGARPKPPGAKDAPRRAGPKGPGPKDAGPAAEARPSGSPRAGGPSPGPRGQRPGSSPPRIPGARPPGRPRPGGRGPRG
jgi:23S rRNA pseudouridine2605 synthase